MNPITILFFLGGLALLIAGAELLVRGASRLAVVIGISPVVVGLTVVAFGTSSPELAVGIKSALTGQTNVSLGNVIGSNIYNILVVLGLSAVVAPLIVAQRLVRVDVPLIIGVSLLLFLLAFDGTLSRGDGALLFSLLLLYIGFVIRQSRRESQDIRAEYEQEFGADSGKKSAAFFAIQGAMVLIGLWLLVVGSDWLVDAAVALARALGVNELVIGLTVVSFGTASPELVTSVVASRRGERDIAVGNVVGSFLFNILAVLGLFAVIAPAGVPVETAVLRFDLPVMTGVALACLPIFFNGYRIERWEGFVFLGYYVAYTAYLLLRAIEHPALPAYSVAMFAFVLPLTAITLIVITVRNLRAARRSVSG